MNSALWEPIWKYLNRINGSMPAVHHYTSVKGALGILESGRFWFTERTHLNDKTEISHGIEICKNILMAQGRERDASLFETSAEVVFRSFRFFSASFTFNMDDPFQWQKYGDHCNGIMLSFRDTAFNDPKKHIDRLVPGNPTAFVFPMSYDGAALRCVLTEIIEKWDGSDIAELRDHVFMISSMFKGNCWSPEGEYRFLVHHQRDEILKNSHFKTRERNGEMVSFLDIPIKNWDRTADFPIYQIFIGPNAPGNLADQLRKVICSKGLPMDPDSVRHSNITCSDSGT